MGAGQRPGRTWRDTALACLGSTACHESIHLVQGVANQVDRDPMSWSAEHDASRGALLVLTAVARRLPDLYPPGALEEISLKGARSAVDVVNAWTEENLEAYNRWAQSFGLKPPGAGLNGDLRFHRQLKGVIVRQPLPAAGHELSRLHQRRHVTR